MKKDLTPGFNDAYRMVAVFLGFVVIMTVLILFNIV